MDQSTAFDIEVKEQCPNAVIVFDLFHVLTNYGRKVIDRVRVDAANQLRHLPNPNFERDFQKASFNCPND